MSLPLEGVRVADLTTFLAGPFCTQLLADLGADVLKIEPPAGDLSRSIPPHFVGDDSAYFLATNRNKRSIVVDLKSDAGREVVLELIERSDVVVESFRPGIADRLGLRVDDIRRTRPELVWASISGFGQEGPWRDRPAYDMIVQAVSGVMSLTGEPDRPPVRLGIPAGDLVAGMYTALGVVAALLGRTASGDGRVLDVSMLDCQLAMLSYQAMYTLVSGVTPGPQGRGHDSIPTYRTFLAGDGREVAVTANTERMWHALCDVLALPELTADARFADAASRLRHAEQLWPLLERRFRDRPADVWVQRLVQSGVPAALIHSVPEALADAERAGRGMVRMVEGRQGQRVRMLGTPLRFSGEELAPLRYPPGLGEDTEAVLRETLGWEVERVEGFLRREP